MKTCKFQKSKGRSSWKRGSIEPRERFIEVLFRSSLRTEFKKDWVLLTAELSEPFRKLCSCPFNFFLIM